MMAHDPRFVYVPASSLASRAIIEQCSYTTTPNLSSSEMTPACGEAVHKKSSDADNMDLVDLKLRTVLSSEAPGISNKSSSKDKRHAKTKKGRKKRTESVPLMMKTQNGAEKTSDSSK